MLDFGFGLHALTLRDLVFALLAMVLWAIAILVVGFDTLVAGFVIGNAIAILVELARRVWRRARRPLPEEP